MAEAIMNNEKKRIDYNEILKKYGIVFILIGMVVILSILRPNFLSVRNIFNLITQTSIYGILALGMLLVIVSKGIDLSVGSVLAFAGVVAASLGQTANAYDKIFPNLPELPLVVLIVVALGLGALLGAINGGLIAYTGVPAFIATLGMYTAARGAALMYTGGKPISNINPDITFFGSRLFNVIPVPVIIYGIMIVITFIIMNYLKFGKGTYAIGGNINAAKTSGIKVKKNIVLIYAYAGLMAGLCAVIFMGRTGGSMQPAAATGIELTAIAAATIGGTSHSGGIGTVWGVVIGALILGVMANGFTLLGINAFIQQIVEGLIIVAAVIFDMRKNKMR
jgi:inositol transport system permease protein